MNSEKFPIGTKVHDFDHGGLVGTVVGYPKDDLIAVRHEFTTSSGKKVPVTSHVNPEELTRVDEVIEVSCYGTVEKWISREAAEEYYLQGMAECEGSEQARYAKIYVELKEGRMFCSD